MSGQTNRITINTKTPEFSTAPSLYGLFFEDINHAADGGLYPEMIRNRAFEDSLVPEECTTDPEENTGKSDAWNSAFGRFIENSPFRGEKNLWAVFWENSAAEDLTEYTFEIDVLRDEDNPLTLNIWNFRPDTDAGCNEPKDTEWTSMSVRRQSWRIDGRTSAVRVPGWLDKPLTPDETVQVDIDFSRYNTYKIAANREGFDCYINGEFVQSCRLPLLPEVTASATGNDEEILVKLVHAGEEASTAVIAPDCAVEDDAVREIIAAPLDAVNSFANKTNVSAKEEKLHLLRNAEGEVIVDLPAHSIQVLRLKKA